MAADRPFPAPFDASTFIIPAEWHAFSDLLGGSDTGLLVLRDGIITQVTAPLAEQLGFDTPELIGRHVESLFPKPTSELLRADLASGSRLRLTTKAGVARRFNVLANRIAAQADARCTIVVLQPAAARADEAAPEEAERVRAIAGQLTDLVIVCDADSGIDFSNRAFDALVGEREETLLELVHADDRNKLATALEHAATGKSSPVAFRLRRHDGSWRHVAGDVCDARTNENIGGLLLTARDVTDLVQQQHDVAAGRKRQLHYLNRLLRLTQRPQTDVSSAIKTILKASAKALGVQRCAYWETQEEPAAARCVMAYDDHRQNLIDEQADLSDTSFAALLPMLIEVQRSERALMSADVDQDPRTTAYCEYFHASGIKAIMLVPVRRGADVEGVLSIAHLEQARQWWRDECEFADNVAGLLSQVFAEEERHRAQANSRRMSQRDHLTGLANKDFLLERAADLFPTLSAKTNTLAAFFIDLDGFQHVNDTLGHEVGDELLRASALRLRNLVRSNDILARLEADEFVLLARDLNDMRIANDIALQIVDALRTPFALQNHQVMVSASVGIALYPFDGNDFDTLMRKAHIALTQAKEAGRNRHRIFAPDGGWNG